MKPTNILEAVDKALSPPPPKKVISYSPELVKEDLRKIKFTPAKADLAAIDEAEPERKRGVAFIKLHSRTTEKPDWLRRKAESVAKVAKGETIAITTRAQVYDEKHTARQIGREAAMPSAELQVQAVRRICMAAADAIETNLDALSNIADSPWARLLVDDPDAVAIVHKAQVAQLRMFAAKIEPTPFFNAKQCLVDFGIPIEK